MLHPFARVCFVLMPQNEWTKLTTQSFRCVFLGYKAGQKGYICYDPTVNRLRVSRNIVFLENTEFFHFSSSSSRAVNSQSFMLIFSKSSSSSTQVLFGSISDFSAHRRFKGVVYQRKIQENQPLPTTSFPEAFIGMLENPTLIILTYLFIVHLAQ